MNDWDFTEEILNDLYKTWPQMLYYTILSFGENQKQLHFLLAYFITILLFNDLFVFVLFTVLTFAIILLIHLLTKCIAYILLIAVTLMVLGNIIYIIH